MLLFWYEFGALADLRTTVCKSRGLDCSSLKRLIVLCVQFTRWDGTRPLVGVNMSRVDCLSTRIKHEWESEKCRQNMRLEYLSLRT